MCAEIWWATCFMSLCWSCHLHLGNRFCCFIFQDVSFIVMLFRTWRTVTWTKRIRRRNCIHIYCSVYPRVLCLYRYVHICYMRGRNGSFIFTLLCGVLVLRHSLEMVAFNEVESAIYIAVQRQCLKPLGALFVCNLWLLLLWLPLYRPVSLLSFGADLGLWYLLCALGLSPLLLLGFFLVSC